MGHGGYGGGEYRLDVLTLTLYKEKVADGRSRTDVKIVNKMRTPSRSFILVPIFILLTSLLTQFSKQPVTLPTLSSHQHHTKPCICSLTEQQLGIPTPIEASWFKLVPSAFLLIPTGLLKSGGLPMVAQCLDGPVGRLSPTMSVRRRRKTFLSRHQIHR